MNRSTKSILAVLIFNTMLITGSVISGLKRGDISHYFKEGETVTFFSTLFLAMVSLTAFLIASLRRRMDNIPLFNFWSLSSGAFFYLMLDENFMIHEGMDRAMLKAFGIAERAYNFDGWILGVMGLMGLFLAYKNRREILRYCDFTFQLKLAFFFFLGMVITDELEIFHPIFLTLDDCFKIVGVSFFLAAYINAFLSAVDQLLAQRS